jgi:hypothetical protein
MASPVETEPWRWGCGGICRTTKQGAHVECAFCTRKFHLVCLPHICPASEISEPHALYVCHAGCRQAFQAGADKRVHCKQKDCPHIKGFANVRALRVHVKHAHEGLRHAMPPQTDCGFTVRPGRPSWGGREEKISKHPKHRFLVINY